jgi:hypothetical protein
LYSILFAQPDYDVKTLEFERGSLPMDILVLMLPLVIILSAIAPSICRGLLILRVGYPFGNDKQELTWIRLGSLLA